MTTLTDVADPACCTYCASTHLEWADGGWAHCRDCTAALRYSRRLGQIVDTEPPHNLQQVSDLLHRLRRG